MNVQVSSLVGVVQYESTGEFPGGVVQYECTGEFPGGGGTV